MEESSSANESKEINNSLHEEYSIEQNDTSIEQSDPKETSATNFTHEDLNLNHEEKMNLENVNNANSSDIASYETTGNVENAISIEKDENVKMHDTESVNANESQLAQATTEHKPQTTAEHHEFISLNSEIDTFNKMIVSDVDPNPTDTFSSNTAASQCTNYATPNDIAKCVEVMNVKTLRHLCAEYLKSLTYGDLILDELAKARIKLTDDKMSPSKPMQQPQVPPRNDSKKKFYLNYNSNAPLVPQRPYIDMPTMENKTESTCMFQSQYESYHTYSMAPNHTLASLNKFVEYRGYDENTDDEVTTINFRDSVPLPKKQTTECEISNMKTKDNNKLLALIREINQLTNTSADSKKPTDHMNEKKETVLPVNCSSQCLADQRSDHLTFKMSHSSNDQNYFNNKRFSNYFDQLCRLNPIVEETPKFHSNETMNYHSHKCTKNYQHFSNDFNSNNDYNSSVQLNCTNEENRFDNTVLNTAHNENKKNSGEVRSVNKIENRHDNHAQNINSSIHTDESWHALNKNTHETQKNPQNDSHLNGFDFMPKWFSNFLHSNKTNASNASDDVKSDEQSETSVQTNFDEKNIQMRKLERYSSTQSLYNLFSDESDIQMPGGSVLGVKGVANTGRISPNPIRAPRINDPIKTENRTSNTAFDPYRYYDWQTVNQYQNFVNRNSMIEQSIDRNKKSNPQRLSMPSVMTMADNQSSFNKEFEKLEMDRRRLIKELEEIQVNQNFERFFKAHKKRNSMLPSLTPVSEEELLKKRLQEEWLSKCAERENRRLQKIIKVTHSTSENVTKIKSPTYRRLDDEFLDRVKERSTKLQIPSDSDRECSAEKQPINTNQTSSDIYSNVKVVDFDQREADLKKLPKHLLEFIEMTTKSETNDDKTAIDVNEKHTLTTESSEMFYKMNRDGKSQ